MVAKKKNIKRVILGVGHPWFFSQLGNMEFDSIGLYPKDGEGYRNKINPRGIGGWNKIRLVAEIIS